ncbi:serine hydrolase [Desulfoscipio geothermicus]|uniref:Beta-lactamase n=1 Tax=Desulfoscipio geothermicus DSM 3669 TaxID=1121426 RepID=A0A1I6EMV6_9FIRM|nr:serine hydrolase [Desulfoscipio geothermicus]SFR18832.1 Beta-lactamase [Desulfoscipio geothermicus DSM 3669]
MITNVEQKLERYFQQQTEAGRFSGTVLVAREGDILLKKGYGFANYETSEKNKPANIYTIGSMTKALVTLSILLFRDVLKYLAVSR